MNSASIATVLICALVGYWAMSAILGSKNRRAPHSKPNLQESMTSEPAAKAPSHEDCFRVLGVSPCASSLEIREAYRRLISQYHPDRVATLGQELRDLAEKKSKEIGAAYEQAMQGKGDRL
jgi:DnaJ like chaperone protein